MMAMPIWLVIWSDSTTSWQESHCEYGDSCLDGAVTDQEQEETQEKSELDGGFTALFYGNMEPGVGD